MGWTPKAMQKTSPRWDEGHEPIFEPCALQSAVRERAPKHKRNRGSAILLLPILGIILGIAAGCRHSDFPDYPANYREYAYVTNGESNTVAVLDMVNLRVDRVLRVGSQPTGIADNPTRNEVYAVNTSPDAANGSVSVIEAESNRVAATIPVRRLPYFISVDAQGKRAYVANSGSNNVSAIDLDSRREIAVVGSGEQPGLVRISPDSRTLVVTNRGGNSVSIYSVSENNRKPLSLRSVIEGCPGATDAVILPDSSKAFIACSSGHQVMAVSLAHPGGASSGPDSGASSGSSNWDDQKDHLLALLDVGKTPVQLALKPDGGEIFVSNFDGNSISEIATGSNEVGGTYMIGEHPVRGIVSRDNSFLWVSNFTADSVSVYSIDDGKLVDNVRTGSAPDALAFSASGNLLLAADSRSGDVAFIRTQIHSALQQRSLFNLLPSGARPNAIVVKAFMVKK